MRRILFTSIAAAALSLASMSQAQAALITPTFNKTDCAGVTLTSITTLTDQSTNLLGSSVYNASQCIGFIGTDDKPKISYNDGPWHVEGSTNIGYLGDGLLNGQVKHGDQYFDGSEFITVPDDLQALKDPAQKVDPGWIHLVSFDAKGAQYEYSTMGAGLVGKPTLNIADLLTFSLECTSGSIGDCSAGTWRLETKLDIIEQVTRLLGPAAFDHLAFSIKTANSFVVYDFNFKDIFAAEKAKGNNSLNFSTPYILAGGFDNSFDLGGQGISHLNVLARDPQDLTRIPEPAPFAIFGLGVLLVLLRARRASA